ncbi:hypothetical protein EV356DRAFT_497064 [Viridothelium virens]|uniref:Cell wall protein n=1 Tax=Viridothelium virens TaxID=1048519 RepID=A0A6A6GU95_VIRVR|nr:hypothetical protein EV356DRAFT_497064 [Viridothelium virens]
MHLSKFLAVSAFVGAPIHAALTASDVVQDIQDVADTSASLTQTVSQLSSLDYSFLVPVSNGLYPFSSTPRLSVLQEIISTLENIITTLGSALTDLGVSDLGGVGSSATNSSAVSKRSRVHVHRRQIPSFPASQPIFTNDADAFYVCQTFRQFVLIHQQLLSTIIGQHGLLATSGFGAPVAAVLRALEGAVDVSSSNSHRPQSS